MFSFAPLHSEYLIKEVLSSAEAGDSNPTESSLPSVPKETVTGQHPGEQTALCNQFKRKEAAETAGDRTAAALPLPLGVAPSHSQERPSVGWTGWT